MTIIPRYDFPLGTEVEFFATRMALTGQTEDGYELCVLETNTTRVISFQHFVYYLKLPGTKIDDLLPETGNRLRQRMGGYASALNLPTQQQEYAQFHLSLCKAMQLLREKTRSETGDPDFALSNNKMNERSNRLFVKKIAEQLFGRTIHIDPGTGGRRTSWGMYKGKNPDDLFQGVDPPPFNWSILKYVFWQSGGPNAEETPQARRDRRQAAPG